MVTNFEVFDNCAGLESCQGGLERSFVVELGGCMLKFLADV
jgi:hypothetical protein